MGGSASALKEQELEEFRKLKDGTDNVEIPTPPSQRTLTDKKGFVVFGILIAVLLPFLIYGLVKSDIRRLYHGHDDCGNLCGVANKKIEGVNCSGKDYTNQPYETVNIREEKKTCTAECPPGYTADGYICYGDLGEGGTIDSVTLAWSFIFNLWWKFLLIGIITTVLSLLTLIIFRYIPGALVWGISILGILSTIGLTILFWVLFAQSDRVSPSRHGFLGLALVSTLFSGIMVVIFLCVFKKIQLVVLLYKETAKALFAMPLMVLLPILTLVLQFLILALLVVTTTYVSSAVELVHDDTTDDYFYKKNGVITFTIIFNVIVAIWSLQFISGCQYMVLSGSMAQWFFKKDQAKSAIIVSFTNTLRYHLGTVAFGSFLITLIAVVKAIFKTFLCNSRTRWICECCCNNFGALLKVLSKNAYIETAIYGQSFLRSGRRAAGLLIKNLETVIALNCVGDFVLAIIEFLLLTISTIIAYAILMNNIFNFMLTFFAFLINLVIVVVIFGVFETIVDTLFICYCEDVGLNDGSADKPYAMTTDFMQFMDQCQKASDKKVDS